MQNFKVEIVNVPDESAEHYYNRQVQTVVRTGQPCYRAVVRNEDSNFMRVFEGNKASLVRALLHEFFIVKNLLKFPTPWPTQKQIEAEIAKSEAAKTPTVRLTGCDGNAFAILGKVRKALVDAGLAEKASEFVNEATKGDYIHLLATAGRYVNIK